VPYKKYSRRRAAILNLIQRLYESFRYRFAKNTFLFWQKLGFHFTRNHYYEPIPDTRTLPGSLWDNPSRLVGIDLQDSRQVDLLQSFEERFKPEYSSFRLLPDGNPAHFYMNNGYFESVDAEILYCMVRRVKPLRIYEIGSGFSTLISAQAVLKNKRQDPNYDCELAAIEPYPGPALRRGFPGLTRLIEQPVQHLPVAMFEQLGDNDILFIDSSHVLKIGSDVQYEFLEILPRLKTGVYVHIHDIFLPAEYSKRTILQDFNFFNEQYILQAFLCFNNSYEVVWGGSYMHLTHPGLLERAFPSYRRSQRWPGSFWIRRIR
jgi:hypothetical protein